MLTKKNTINLDTAENFINAAPLSTNRDNNPKTEEPRHLTYLHIPIQRELRNRLKAKAALNGKSLYDYCTEVLEASLELDKEGESK